ncbi:PREDICTED: battenin-like, partial [Rhagoletis zephyria]
MTSNQEVVVASPVTPHPPPKDRKLWRDLTAYWILGLCNNYGYVVMLSAAHDIIAQFQDSEVDDNTTENTDEDTRKCHLVSTGAILLADILPSLCVKIVIPFLPFWVNFKILLAVLLSASGFLLVGFATAEWMALLGVVITSASSGIGEPTFLSYSSHFHKNVVSTWSSGTGGAGVIGSLSYASLRALGVSPRDTML